MIVDIPANTTEKCITNDELTMLNGLKENVMAKAHDYEVANSVLAYALGILRVKYNCSDREVVAEDGTIVEMTEEAFENLNLHVSNSTTTSNNSS